MTQLDKKYSQIKIQSVKCGNHPLDKEIILTNKVINFSEIYNKNDNTKLEINSWYIERKDKNMVLHFYTKNFYFTDLNNYEYYYVFDKGSPYYGCSYNYRNCECYNFSIVRHYTINIFTYEFKNDIFVFRNKNGYIFITPINKNHKQKKYEIIKLFNN
jgi:hypothetical protein